MAGGQIAQRTSPTLEPEAPTSFSPPTEARNTGGILIVAITRGTLARETAR